MSRWLLLLSLVFGGVAVFMMQSHIASVKGETVSVFRATAAGEIGETMGEYVETVEIPSGMFPALLEEAPTSELYEFVTSTELRSAVDEGDVLLFRHFDAAIDGGVQPKIPAGMKAIAIPVTEQSAVGYFIQPGDFVDVLGTFFAEELGAPPEVSTKPIVQACQVLAVGDSHLPSQNQKRDAYSSITLLVTMEEAAKLIFARDFYNVNMTLVLRGEGDVDVDADIPSVRAGDLDFDRIGNAARR